MRIKVGFFTAKHPTIDDKVIGDSYVILWSTVVNAKDHAEAVKIAKQQVDLELLRTELTRRYPNAMYVNYTSQVLGKGKPRTWCRSFSSWLIRQG